MTESSRNGKNNNEVRIQINSIVLEGNLVIPEEAHGIVVLHMVVAAVVTAHGINMLHGNFRKKALGHYYLTFIDSRRRTN